MDASSTAHEREYGLTGLGLEQLRLLRRDAQDQEADLSYLRRLLHGRLDILRAELARRGPPGPPSPGPTGCRTPCSTSSRRSWRTPRHRSAARPATCGSARRAGSATSGRRTP
ncbi:hypothetical protein ACFQ0T_18235 [Kitasatospora gansuensis]